MWRGQERDGMVIGVEGGDYKSQAFHKIYQDSNRAAYHSPQSKI